MILLYCWERYIFNAKIKNIEDKTFDTANTTLNAKINEAENEKYLLLLN